MEWSSSKLSWSAAARLGSWIYQVSPLFLPFTPPPLSYSLMAISSHTSFSKIKQNNWLKICWKNRNIHSSSRGKGPSSPSNVTQDFVFIFPPPQHFIHTVLYRTSFSFALQWLAVSLTALWTESGHQNPGCAARHSRPSVVFPGRAGPCARKWSPK